MVPYLSHIVEERCKQNQRVPFSFSHDSGQQAAVAGVVVVGHDGADTGTGKRGKPLFLHKEM